MFRTVLAILPFLALSFASCNQNDAQHDALLKQPPFDQISDSIDRDPGNAALYFRRGTQLYRRNETILAEKDLRKAWELEPNEKHAQRLAAFLVNTNQDQAIAFLQDAIAQIPTSIGLQIMLAKGYQSRNNLEAALEILNRLLAQFPGQLDALVMKAEILKARNNTTALLQTLETAHSFAPDDLEVMHMLAFVYAESKNPRALNLADSLIEADAGSRRAEPFYYKGVYYANLGRPEEAIRQFDAAIARNYNFLDAYINKGAVYYDQKKLAKAMEVFALANRISPDEAEPYYWMAKTQEAAGNKTEARLNYQRAYGLDKTLEEAREAAERLK